MLTKHLINKRNLLTALYLYKVEKGDWLWEVSNYFKKVNQSETVICVSHKVLPARPVCFPISNRRNSFGSESEMRRDCKIGFGIWRKRIRPDNDFQDNPDLLWRSREVSRSVFLPPTWWGSSDRISSESESDPRLGLRPLSRRPWGLRTRRSWTFWRFGCRKSRNRFS